MLFVLAIEVGGGPHSFWHMCGPNSIWEAPRFVGFLSLFWILLNHLLVACFNLYISYLAWEREVYMRRGRWKWKSLYKDNPCVVLCN